jgi:hypothetical protein
VATKDLNVATDNCSKWISNLHFFQILTKAETEKPLLSQLGQISQQRECGMIH